jgi:uncharacterized membrane protein
VLGYGHIEHPLMLFLMLASVRSLMLQRTNRAGLLLGLALLTRSSAVLYLIPLTMLLLFSRDWWGAARFAGITLATLVLGLLPFALADWHDLVYSLFTFHGLLPVGGGSVWGLTMDTPLSTVGDKYDSVFVIGSSLILSLALLLWCRNISLGSADVYALLAISGLCFPLFLKTLWPYYYLDAYMLLALWWLAQAGELKSWGQRILWFCGVILPVSAVLAGQLSEYGLTSNGQYWTKGWSLTMTIVTVAMMALVLGILWFKSLPRRSREERQVPESAWLHGQSYAGTMVE